ncbi:hypothetical protein LTSEALA_3830 [Salmonella enterica subsp. enterica serovar Alachua str. R6-377]|uniref:Lipoprotein n=1 Tax=Salmonella enterica subsp. enterica serovar Alachua str. R6-377 TaxID=913241 RepID=G5LS67_SALET|nr:hypothetical protein LTSEALA_3830 [Salmonella enterica subsp. enterica serovar Alachua str. R6-377]
MNGWRGKRGRWLWLAGAPLAAGCGWRARRSAFYFPGVMGSG